MHPRRTSAALAVALVTCLVAPAWSAQASPEPAAPAATRSTAEPTAQPTSEAAAEPAAQPTAEPLRRQTRPNVVLIVTDDQTLADLRVMRRTRTFFANRGVRFTRAFSQFPLCCPARASLLTGQLAHNHRVQSNDPPRGGFAALDARETLPVWLRRVGYRTAMVGKYLNGYPAPGGKRHVPRGWTDWRAPIQNVYDYMIFRVNQNGRLLHHRGYQARWVQRQVSGLVRRYAAGSRPFFVWANFLGPHNGRPIEPDDPVRRVGARGVGTPAVEAGVRNSMRSRALPRKPSINERHVGDKGRPAVVGSKPRWQLRELYTQRLESLLSVDRAVAGIISTLRRTRRLGNTLLLFTSDNGYLVGEHRLVGKSMPYEESVRVPLLMAGPGVPAGVRRSQLVGLVDITRTVLRLAGARARRVQDGTSLLPLAADPAAGRDRSLLLEGEARLRGRAPLFTGVRTGDDQVLIRWRGGREEVYDLARDPFQLDGRVSAAEAAQLPRLRGLLRRLRHCVGYRACAGLPG